MTAVQKAVLKYMHHHRLTAILYDGAYRFSVDFLNDPNLAERISERNCFGRQRVFGSDSELGGVEIVNCKNIQRSIEIYLRGVHHPLEGG